MKRIKEIKETALAAIHGHWNKAIIPVLILAGFSIVIEGPTIVYQEVTRIGSAVYFPTMEELITNFCLSSGSFLLSVFFIWPLTVGISNSYKVFYRTGNDRMGHNAINLAYGKKKYWRNVGLQVVKWIYLMLWTLLLIIPGYIKMYAYSMASYVIQDNPEIGIDDAIERSIELMDGHKWKLFVLDLSFLGWILASALTLFIGMIWVIPYMEMAHLEFYQELLEEEKEKEGRK